MKAKQISLILTDLVAEQNQQSHISFYQIVTALGDRAFGLVILFFALPSALPFSAIPGVSLVFSLPILLIALQMVFGRSNLWLPSRLGNQQVKLAQLKLIVAKALPYLRWLEKILETGLGFLFYPGHGNNHCTRDCHISHYANDPCTLYQFSLCLGDYFAQSGFNRKRWIIHCDGFLFVYNLWRYFLYPN